MKYEVSKHMQSLKRNTSTRCAMSQNLHQSSPLQLLGQLFEKPVDSQSNASSRVVGGQATVATRSFFLILNIDDM